jgi:alpha-glucuronidase
MIKKSKSNHHLTTTLMRTLLLVLLMMTAVAVEGKVKVKNVTPQTTYAASRLSTVDPRLSITITVSGKGEAEGFTLIRKGKKISITGNDGNGAIYGANRLLELYQADPTLSTLSIVREVPEMKLRGACVGLQKTEYLPGH